MSSCYKCFSDYKKQQQQHQQQQQQQQLQNHLLLDLGMVAWWKELLLLLPCEVWSVTFK
jgi:hypothetical protein